MTVKTIVTIKCGSHLYGTNTQQSDLDLKGIYLPSAQAILLQKIQPVILANKNKKHGEKNNPTDIDYELYSPEKFLCAIAKGQSIALEMLFAPDSALLYPPDPVWYRIKKLAPRLLTKQAASFVTYCKQQAYKYCKKGAKLAAARSVLNVLLEAEKHYGTSTKLVHIVDTLQNMVHANENITISSITQSHGTQEWYFEICGKKISFHVSIKNACVMVQKIVNEYGERSLQAEQNEGADWKALSHAVRIGYQAIEFLKEHQLTFPRPEKEHLLAIKQGKINFENVAQEIEQLLVDVEQAAQKSSLPETYNPQEIDAFIEQLHLQQILEKTHS